MMSWSQSGAWTGIPPPPLPHWHDAGCTCWTWTPPHWHDVHNVCIGTRTSGRTSTWTVPHWHDTHPCTPAPRLGPFPTTPMPTLALATCTCTLPHSTCTHTHTRT